MNGHDAFSPLGSPLPNGSDSSTTECGWVLIGRPHEKASIQRTPIVAQPYSVGRHPDNELCLANPTVSGHHAELISTDGEIFVRDLDSTNGTLLNGRSVHQLTPLQSGDMVHFGNAMFTLERTADERPTKTTLSTDVIDEALAQVQFDKLIEDPAVKPYFQPIIRLEDYRRVGYEVLARSQLVGLETPYKMFRVAAERMEAPQLSVLCRSEGLRIGQTLGADVEYFVNTHPAEMETTELLESLTQLREDNPDLAFTLEVHESAVTSTAYLRRLHKVLNELRIGLAYDDFGAGQARLMELVEVPPDVLKFDVKLIRGLSSASQQHRSMVGSLIKIVKDLNVIPLAEGVEMDTEADICRELGFELAQGYLFGRPGPVGAWTDGENE
ncbi:MAG: EAL domain-containing protein [Pirellulaceae bacterium]|nr:EAL domain-containing protein [Pirellulaceae bacterium]MDP7018810.1 EAL domain-containing protein [Pirellulaceae bacterium]